MTAVLAALLAGALPAPIECAAAHRLSASQQSALLRLDSHGAMERSPRGFGRLGELVSMVNARTMLARDLAVLSPAGWLSLTARGHRYAVILLGAS